MDYIEQGIFELDIETLPALKVLPRAISSKSSEVEIFIKSDGVYLFAKDLAGNVNYIAQESNKRIKMYGDTGTGGVNFVKGNSGLDLEGLDYDDLDLDDFLDDIDSLGDVKDDKFEIEDGEPQDVWEDFIDEDNKYAEIFTKAEEDELYCRFATSADILKVFGLYKKVRLTVLEKEIIIESVEDLTKVKFARTRSYTEVDKIEQLITDLEWEEFPTESVKSIVPAIEKIEPLKYKQTMSILGNKLYTFSDTIAVETSTNALSRNYLLSSEVLRILKYAVGKTTSVKISQTKNGGVALNIDNLVVIFGTMNQTTSNLFDLTRGTLKKQPFIEIIDKKFIDKLTMAKNIFKNYTNITIETSNDMVILKNDRMETVYLPTKKVSNGKQVVMDVEKLLLAIKLTGSPNPTISLYKVKEKAAMMVLEGTVSVLIDANEYSESVVSGGED